MKVYCINCKYFDDEWDYNCVHIDCFKDNCIGKYIERIKEATELNKNFDCKLYSEKLTILQKIVRWLKEKGSKLWEYIE